MTQNACKAVLVIATVTLGLQDVGVVNAGLFFGIPTKLPDPFNSSPNNLPSSISSDGREFYFYSDRGGDCCDAWVAKREDLLEQFGPPEFVADVNSIDLSHDGLTLFVNFGNGRGEFGRNDIFSMTRPTKDDPWGSPENLGPNVNSAFQEKWADISADGLSLYYTRNPTQWQTPFEIWVSERPDLNSDFGVPTKLPPNINDEDATFTSASSISSDGLVLYFASDRPGSYSSIDIWVSQRATTDEPWGDPVNLGLDVNSAFEQWQPDISADGETLYFSRSPNGFSDYEIWQVPVLNTGIDVLAINGGGETYFEDFDFLETRRNGMPDGWSGVTKDGETFRVDGLGLTDGFLTEPGSDNDGVLGVLNLGGNADSFGPAPDGFIPTWTAEWGGENDRYGHDDVISDNATDRALGVSRENNDDAGELNFEIEIAGATLRAFVLDWDLEIWGGDPDADFRSPEGAGMKVDVSVGGTSYSTMAENLLPGTKFDSSEDESGSIHNATLIDGNVYSVRNISSRIKEVSDADGAVGNLVQINFNSNWNGTTDNGANGWFSAVDNVRLRALAPGDADANGVVDVADLLTLLGGQKFNQGVDGVTWEQGDFNADDQFNTGDLLSMLAFLSGTFPTDPYASEAGASVDAVADVIVNSETGEVTVDLAGHTVSAILIESAAEIFNGVQPDWDTTSQFPSTLPSELGNVLFTSTASGVDELGTVISQEFLGRDKEFYLQDLDLNIMIASDGGALTKGNVIVVPEPSTWLLLLTGTLLVGWRQGRARRSPGKQ